MAYAPAGRRLPHAAGALVAFAYVAAALPLFAASVLTDDVGRQEALRGLSMAPSALLCMAFGVEGDLARHSWTNGPVFHLAASLLLSYALGWVTGLTLPVSWAGPENVREGDVVPTTRDWTNN